MQVGLTLGFGEIDEIGLGQARRQFEHRTGNRDIVVIGQDAQHLDRRVADRRKAMGQFGTRLVLDFLDEQREDVVEQVDMGIAVASSRRQEIAP